MSLCILADYKYVLAYHYLSMIYVRVLKDETNGLARSMKKVKSRPLKKFFFLKKQKWSDHRPSKKLLDLNAKSVQF